MSTDIEQLAADIPIVGDRMLLEVVNGITIGTSMGARNSGFFGRLVAEQPPPPAGHGRGPGRTGRRTARPDDLDDGVVVQGHREQSRAGTGAQARQADDRGA